MKDEWCVSPTDFYWIARCWMNCYRPPLRRNEGTRPLQMRAAATAGPTLPSPLRHHRPPQPFQEILPRAAVLWSALLCTAVLRVVSDLVTPCTVAHQAALSMGILQARTLEWVARPSSKRSSQPRDRTQVSHITGGFFTIWAPREAQGIEENRPWGPRPGHISSITLLGWGQPERWPPDIPSALYLWSFLLPLAKPILLPHPIFKFSHRTHFFPLNLHSANRLACPEHPENPENWN